MCKSNYSVIDGVNLPHSIDAEQAVLGAILKDPDCLHIVADMLKIEHIYLPQHKEIYSAICSMLSLLFKIEQAYSKMASSKMSLLSQGVEQVVLRLRLLAQT